MADKAWKAVERRMARDVGTERIPVTGERHGADFEDGIAAYQVKNRRCLPSWLWSWLGGISATAKAKDKVGCLVLKTPGMQDAEAVVILSWQDWTALHGKPADGVRDE